MSTASFRERLLDFRSCWIVFIHVVRVCPGGLRQFSKKKAVKIFLASVSSRQSYSWVQMTKVQTTEVIVLATEVNKYSLTTASCQQRWSTNWIHRDLFFAAEQRTVGWLGLPITTKQQSVVWSVSQSRHMSAIILGSSRWLHLRRQVAPLWCKQRRTTGQWTATVDSGWNK